MYQQENRKQYYFDKPYFKSLMLHLCSFDELNQAESSFDRFK